MFKWIERIKSCATRAVDMLQKDMNLENSGWDQDDENGIGKNQKINDCLYIFLGLTFINGKYIPSIDVWHKAEECKNICYNGQAYVPHIPDMEDEGGWWSVYKVDESLFSDERQNDLNDFVSSFVRQFL